MSMHNTSWLVALLLLTGRTVSAVSLYQVGNSLTADSRAEGTALMAASQGITLDFGRHIRPASTLDTIWNRPEDVDDFFTIEEFGTFTGALANHTWDHVMLQSHRGTAFDGSPNTLGDEIARIADFKTLTEANSSNANTSYHIHAPWPWRTRWGDWDNPATNDPAEETINSLAYYDTLLSELDTLYPGRFRMVPTGEVLATLAERIDSGEFTGLTSVNQLYADVIHMNSLGDFVASTTVYATILRKNPVGVPVPRSGDGSWGFSTMPDTLALELQQLVWDVVVQQRWTGVSPIGDLNVDTMVDEQDYAMWLSQYGFQDDLSADANQDEVVDTEDANIWFTAAVLDEGDYNNDSLVNGSDVSFWQDAFGTVGSSPADGNNDGIVDAADYTVVRDVMSAIEAADFDGDGDVDTDDFLVWEHERGWKTHLEADLNDDGTVDAADYTIWRDSFELFQERYSSEASSIPEPASLTLVLMGALLVIRRRR